MAKTKTVKGPVGDSRDHKGMILDADRWPCWPFLPVKRNNNSLEDKNLGVVMCDPQYTHAVKGSAKFVVYHVYLFDRPKGKDEWESAPKTEYNNVDEMLRDGWIVD